MGRPPSRLEMFNKFYTHADGTPSSTVVAENLVRVNEKQHNYFSCAILFIISVITLNFL